jgi:hypothetical protein
MAAGDDDEAGEESNGVEFVTSERVNVVAMLVSLSSSHGGSSEFGKEVNSSGDSEQLIEGNEEERKGVTSVWLVGGEVAGAWLRCVVVDGGPLVTLNFLPGTRNGMR